MRIELRDVGKRFGQVVALAGVSLEVPSGARVALIGPNGSGKTTLTRAIMGVIEHEGEILVDGRSVRGERAALATRLAYVPQVAPQMAASVSELMRTVASVRGLPVAGFEALARGFELDPVALARRPFRGLSGGMKQKLLLALALATAPALIVLDEPTASLDAASRERFYELYARHAGDATLLLCSHRIEEIRHLVDHVIALEDGHVVYHGRADAYLAARTAAMIELELDPASAEAAAWVRARGFVRGAGGWWSLGVSTAEKLRLLPEAFATLGGRLRNVCVRDLDRIEPEAATPAEPVAIAEEVEDAA
jgi:ABC-type multidrug transport system ATPase subunit